MSYVPSHRARSRQSTASTTPDSLNSWSMSSSRAGGPSTTTSLSAWSDDGATVLPSSDEGLRMDGKSGYSGYYPEEEEVLDDRPLIELDSDGEAALKRAARTATLPLAGASQEKPKPSEELRRLLRQMEAEARSTTPAPQQPRQVEAGPSRSPIKRPSSLPAFDQDEQPRFSNASNRRANWREGRRIGVYPPYSSGASGDEDTTGPRRRRESVGEDDDEDSPPTPPLRITNPYSASGRKTSETSSSKGRLPSRAAVLQNSISHSPPSTARSHSPTPLETFIATRAAPSFNETRSSPSRKGKSVSTPESHPSRNQEGAGSSPSRSSRGNGTKHTPRKYSVELAPDDLHLFGADLQGLEVPGEMELDLDEEASGLMRPWASESEGTDGGSGSVEMLEENEQPGLDRFASPEKEEASVDRTAKLRHSSRSAFVQPQSRFRSPQATSRNISADEEVSLPALPDGEDSGEGADIEDRRATMFRSGSHSRASLSPQQRSEKTSPARFAEITRERTPQIAVNSDHGLSFQSSSSHLSRSAERVVASPVRTVPTSHPAGVSTPPIRVAPAPPTASGGVATPNKAYLADQTGLTPHPPGYLHISPNGQSRSVRFSPLRKNDTEWSLSNSSAAAESEISVHRLKLSPAKRAHSRDSSKTSPSPLRSSFSRHPQETSKEDGDTSFTGQIKKYLFPITLPKASTTLADAEVQISRARRDSEAAKAQVEQSQKAWMEAFRELQLLAVAGQVGGVVKKGYGWGNWAWWICVEIFLLWGVFRVTLDYAASLDPSPNSFRTINLNPHALAVPLPSALSAFIVPRRSANFFDLLESHEVWRKLGLVMEASLRLGEKAGVIGPGPGMAQVGNGGRMIGGVPS